MLYAPKKAPDFSGYSDLLTISATGGSVATVIVSLSGMWRTALFHREIEL